MRKLFLLSLIFLCLGCSPQEEPKKQPEVVLNVNPTTLSFSAEGGSQDVVVTSSASPLVSPWDNWITHSKGSFASNKVTITLTAAENKVAQTRTTRVSFVNGDEKVYVDITQEAGKPEPGEDVGPGPDFSNMPVPTDNAAWAVSSKLGIGWNLGNHFDAHINGKSSETAWGNPKATQATMDAVKKAGFNTVRIPVTWMGHIGEAPDYKIEDAWLNRVAEVVGYAEKAGLNVVLNMHHDGADSKYWLNIKNAAKSATSQEQIVSQLTKMWTQIAEKFKDKGDFLIFECCNEIHDGGWGWGENRSDGGKQYRCLNEWNAAFVSAVRAVGGENANRYLGVPAYCTNVDLAIESFVMPEDNVKDKLILSVHCYDPYDYCLSAKYSQWGHTAASANKVSGDNESQLMSVFQKIYQHYISNGIPVYLGEFGCVNRETEKQQRFQRYYLKFYASLSRTFGVPSMIWDNGAKGSGAETHAFIDHGTGKYQSKEGQLAIEALVSTYKDVAATPEKVYGQAP